MNISELKSNLAGLVKYLETNGNLDGTVERYISRLQTQLRDLDTEKTVNIEAVGKIEKSKDGEDTLEKKAQELAREEGIEKSSAYDRLLAEDAELYDEYLAKNNWGIRRRN
jgi:predicted Holliday junction resolvase-like endonuclease